MAEVQQCASKDKVLVFDGQVLHKRAFPKKGKPSKKNAALVAGVLEDDLEDTEPDGIIKRMT